MDNLRSAIADKVLDISAFNGDDMKAKLEKINRFRDFANACQLLIKKYPAIESELLQMVENNDFDTRIASSRVDTIIRLSERESDGVHTASQVVEDDIHNLEKITEEIISSEEVPPVATATADLTASGRSQSYGESQESKSIGSQKATNLLTEEGSDEPEKIGQYVDFEEIDENTAKPVDNFINPVVERKSSLVIEEDNRKKDTVKKIIQVCGIIAIVVALIFIIKFVINNWVAILYGLGALVLVGGIVYFLLKKKKSDE